MNQPLRYGIVGCGMIGPWHAKSVGLAKGAELVAICDIIPEKAQKFSADYGPKAYTDYQKMLDEANLDIVSICTPSGMHSEMALAAADRGVNVLTEKPMDVTIPAIEAMIAGCRAKGVKLGCIFQRRTSPLWKSAREIVQSGKLGKMVLGDAYLKYYRSPEYYASADWRGTWKWDGGGSLMNQGVHCVDLLTWVMGPVKTVTAHAAPLVRNIEVEDTAVGILQFESGAFGVLEGTTSVCPGMNHRLEFHGEFGTLRIEGEKIVELRSSLINDEEKEEYLSPKEVEQDDTARDPKAVGILGHAILVQDMINAVIENREPMIPGEQGRKAVELILAVYKSSQTGRRVDL